MIALSCTCASTRGRSKRVPTDLKRSASPLNSEVRVRCKMLIISPCRGLWFRDKDYYTTMGVEMVNSFAT